jgi:hypothetical protein
MPGTSSPLLGDKGIEACRRFISWLNEASAIRNNAKRAEILAADRDALRRGPVGTLSHADLARAPCEHALEGLLVPSQLLPHRLGQLRVRARGDTEPAVAVHDTHLDK